MNNANSYDVQVFRVWYIIVFVPEFPPEIPMGIYGIPLCPMETRSVRHGKPWRVARQPAVPHRMHCIPHGIPRVPGVYDNKINMRVNPRLISTEISGVVPNATQGLGYLRWRKPTSYDGIFSWNASCVPSHWTHHGNSRGTPKQISRHFPPDPTVCHGVPWDPTGTIGIVHGIPVGPVRCPTGFHESCTCCRESPMESHGECRPPTGRHKNVHHWVLEQINCFLFQG